jgi:hypothetical protein
VFFRRFFSRMVSNLSWIAPAAPADTSCSSIAWVAKYQGRMSPKLCCLRRART